MTSTAIPRAMAFAAVVIAGMPAAGAAQTAAQMPPAPGMMGQGPGAQSGQPGMMGQGMMGMHGPMMRVVMKVMFAVADADGDGALTFEEVTTVRKRIFDKVDANKDDKVTLEEAQAFMRE